MRPSVSNPLPPLMNQAAVKCTSKYINIIQLVIKAFSLNQARRGQYIVKNFYMFACVNNRLQAFISIRPYGMSCVMIKLS